MSTTSTQRGSGPTSASVSPTVTTLVASAASRSRTSAFAPPSATGTRTRAEPCVHSKWASSPLPCSRPQNPSTRWASRHTSPPPTSTPDSRTPRSRLSPVPGRKVGDVIRRSRKRSANTMRGQAAPSSASASSSATSGASQSGSTKASLLTRATKSTSSRSRMATLLAGNPRLAPTGRSSTSGNRSRSAPSLPSDEALSTTTTSRSSLGHSVRVSASTQSRTWRPPL